jgi:NAD(P)-dependent dehydrogenase (short-subunit alcohol dehydrogenase family)
MQVFDLFRLDGRVALITGGSKGLGLSIARAFAQAGADLAVCARGESPLESARQVLENEPRTFSGPSSSRPKVLVRTADLSKSGEADSVAQWALEHFGRVDILINNAGNNEPQNLVEATNESWERILRLNLTSCMEFARAVAPGMIERRWGRIIHMSSVMAVASNPGRGSYSATKAALMGMTRAHALELGPHGITVNCIGPGPMLTDLPLSLLNEEQKRSFAERTAVKRWGKPEEISGPALLLASEAGRNITGTMLLVDGGLVCRTF